jgi:hypothetical protein
MFTPIKKSSKNLQDVFMSDSTNNDKKMRFRSIMEQYPIAKTFQPYISLSRTAQASKPKLSDKFIQEVSLVGI